MQSKNLPLIINLAGPKGVSAVVREPVLWMSGACILSSPSLLAPLYFLCRQQVCWCCSLLYYLLCTSCIPNVRIGECDLHVFKHW